MAKFDEHAEAYDSWFFDNENMLMSELKIVAHFLEKDTNILSIGCGSGLFEMLLAKHYGIEVKHGIEPSQDMAKIAIKRGMEVKVNTAEAQDIDAESYDIIMFNGSPSYISDLDLCIKKAYYALKQGGKLIVIDVPKESGFATLYNLAAALGTWDNPYLEGISPQSPYPIELVKSANWRTTDEKIELMTMHGFSEFSSAQTLLTHPMYANDTLQDVVDGHDRGDYVAVCGYKRQVL